MSRVASSAPQAERPESNVTSDSASLRDLPVAQPHDDATAEIVPKIQWLMFFRAVMVTVLLGSTLAVNVDNADLFSNPSTLTLLGLIIGTYVLTIVYAGVLRYVRRYALFTHIQLVGDLLTTMVLVLLTGGADSVFLFMFSLIVINAAILLYRPGALLHACVSAIILVGLISGQAFGWGADAAAIEGPATRGLLLSGVANVSAVFLVALLSGYLSEQLRNTDRRLQFASEGLRQLRALNENIATSVQSGLVSYTLDGHIIFFNPAAERITGLISRDVLYRDVDEVFPSVTDHSPTAQGHLNRWEGCFVRPDGQRQILGYSLSPLVDGKEAHRGWILIFQDLTPLRDMEQTIQRTEKFAAIGKMAAGIAHELRNPLASISGSIQMLELAAELGTDDRRLMNIILREIDRLNSLIDDFLDFARPSPPRLQEFSACELVGEVVQVFDKRRFGHGHGRGGQTHSVSLDRHGEPSLRADPLQMRQVLWNLLNNAAQAMSEGGEIRVRVLDEAAPDGQPGTVTFEVIDSGVGIPPDQVPKIFDPFFSTKEEGTGLGLSLVHRIIEDHQGTLRVRSVPDHGSTFSVVLPVEGPTGLPAIGEGNPVNVSEDGTPQRRDPTPAPTTDSGQGPVVEV